MTTEETDTAATVVAQGAHGAPERASSKKGASHKKGAKPDKGKAKPSAPKKNAKASKKPTKAKTAPSRSESKGAKILELIARAKGATLAELMKVTDWQSHSIRGYLSTAAKKHGIKIESAKNEGGERTYKS